MVFLCTLFNDSRGLSIEKKGLPKAEPVNPKFGVNILCQYFSNTCLCALALEGEGQSDIQGDPIVSSE